MSFAGLWRFFPPWLGAVLSGEQLATEQAAMPADPGVIPAEPEPKPDSSDTVAAIFVALRASPSPGQKHAATLILKECAAHGVTNPKQVAYILATCWHECRFKSIKEIRAKPGTEVWKMQEKYWHTGYYGRGFCQLTWRRNYEKFSPITGRDLVNNPDEVLYPEVGALILVRGMRDGMFSGKKLRSYLDDIKSDWLGARRVVNGDFQADMVKVAALKILPLLT